MPRSSLLHPVTGIDRITADAAVQALAARFAPLDLELAPASDNPAGAQQGFDTWGRAPRITLGVPEGATRDEVLEAMWQALLLGEGWPEPAEGSASTAGLRLGLLKATARARARSAGADAAGLVADDLRSLCMSLDPEAPAAGLLAAGWFVTVPLGPRDRTLALSRIAHCDEDLAAAVQELLDLVPEAPRTAAQAEALLDCISRLP